MTTDSTNGQTYANPLPVVPYPESLPLNDPNLPWERFEAFCEELISRLPGVKETHRYGRRGSRQRGIDIFANLDNGERWAFQCRQWEKVTKAEAARAIEQTSYQADRFILTLSSQATSAVRDACDGHTNWDVWDVGDISRKVRDMALQSAARLVEGHFGPAWRKAFLGLSGLTPFVAPTGFFGPLLNESALFNHTWQLVGRSDHIRETHEFIESQLQNVAILVGRGGIGKSKILHALAESFDTEHEGIALWFMAEGVPLTQDGADHLPYQPCVVVVDDAHRRGDLPALLALSRQRPHATKLILSCRPQGIGYLKSQLTEGGFDVHEVVDLPDVNELSRAEVTVLGRQALGTEFEHLAEQLSEATWDCPLVTVVGGQLLAQRAIPPDLLERDEEFRATVLARFRDVLIGEVGDRVDPNLCTSLLNLISGIQPIRLDNEKALDFEADFLGIDSPRLLLSLGALEEAGVLLRRGNTLRIVPDVLADHILHQVSITPQGQKTGYADTIFHQFASLCPTEVLRNLSELDWRLRRSGAQASGLLSGIWQNIEQEFEDASNAVRCRILRILEDIAVYQPEKTLELVEYAIRNPAITSEDPEWSRVYEFTHNDVLCHLPTLLRRISYTLDFIPRCFSLLWELGRDDARELNSSPDHPMRVLADLASYDIGKPFVVSHLMLDALEKLFEEPSSHEHLHSPLDIINPMWEKTDIHLAADGYHAGHSTRSEGHVGLADGGRSMLVFRPFTLKDENVKSIRQRSLSLVVSCLSSSDLKVSLRALRSLESGLREPIGVFEMKISDEDREQWRPEQLEILTHIGDLARRSTEPVVLLRIKEILWWHRSYSTSEVIRDRADGIVSSMPGSFELSLTQELMDPFHSRDLLPDEREGDDWYKRQQERVEQTQRALVSELISRSGNAKMAYSILTDRVRAMADAGVRAEPQVLLGILGDSDPEFAAGICDIIVGNPDGALAPFLQPLLSNVRIWNAERAHTISQRVLERGSNVLCYGVSVSYQSRGWAEKATAQDIENIRELLDHEDLRVRAMAIGSLGALAEAHQRVALDLAKDVDLGGSDALASQLCRLFFRGWGIPFSELTADDLKVILSKLEEVPDIEDFPINDLLVKASERDAVAVIGLLLKRIARSDNEKLEYRALPILGFNRQLTGLATSPEQENLLREIRDASLKPGWAVERSIPQLFREVSSGFKSAASLKVLNEWINSGDPAMIESAARLVSGAPPGFVFKHVDFVENLLDRAHAMSYDNYRRVGGNLMSSVLTGTRSGTPGQPMPEDVAIRDQATAVASQFDAGSPAHRFYASLAESAKTSIMNALLRDEELSQ